jgi:hypothetical protein
MNLSMAVFENHGAPAIIDKIWASEWCYAQSKEAKGAD